MNLSSLEVLSILLIISTLTSISCTTHETPCSRYHTGKFFYSDHTYQQKFFITRTDFLQIETNTRTGEVYSFKIKWINDCEFFLYSLTDSIEHVKAVPVDVNILQSHHDYYIFSSHAVRPDAVYLMDTVWLRNN